MANEEAMIDTPEGIRDYLDSFHRIPGIRVIKNTLGDEQMSVRSDGVVRGGSNDGETRGIALNEKNEQLVAQGLPPYAELTRLGGGFSVIQIVATAGLVVRPSTLSAITLWNGEGSGGKSYVIDRLFTHNLVSTAAIHQFGIWACVHPAGMTAPGVDIAASAVNVTGNAGKLYNGRSQVGVAETVIANGWYPWCDGNQITVVNATPGSHSSVEVAGRLIVPPGGAISLQVLSGVTGDTFTTGLSWYEVQLALE